MKQVEGEPGELETLSSGKVVAKENGYVYVFTSNESQQDVLFDNMSVYQSTGPILEETHYYPFGLVMDGISTVAPLKLANNYKYNGKELNHKEYSDGTGLDWYSYGMREYDPQIGRFPQLDPLTDEFAALTPYQYASNDPIANIDLDGLEGSGATKAASALSDFTYFYRPVSDATIIWKPVVHAAKTTTTSTKALQGLKILSAGSIIIHGAQVANAAINQKTVTKQAGEIIIKNGLASGNNAIVRLEPVVDRGKLPKGVQAIVLHRTAGGSAQGAINTWVKENGRVGAHVVVDKDGKIIQVVNFNDKANHVGKTRDQSYPNNSNSVGVEVVGRYDEKTKTWEPLTQKQINSTADMVNALMETYGLTPKNIYEHDVISWKTPGEGTVVRKSIESKLETLPTASFNIKTESFFNY